MKNQRAKGKNQKEKRGRPLYIFALRPLTFAF
jgi:hypothetical protein